MKRLGLLAVFGAVLMSTGGCTIRAQQMKTITIQPQKDPVVITATGSAACTNYLGLWYTVTEEVGVVGSNGQKADGAAKQ